METGAAHTSVRAMINLKSQINLKGEQFKEVIADQNSLMKFESKISEYSPVSCASPGLKNLGHGKQ
jgi:hypothetical protein